mmetsp:Transcript_37670/g.73603  ORF Transcript_37670/g.73603 Transcript_37670/m.73603 type:complete len:82 (-) Transcript_37670:28-273(-)
MGSEDAMESLMSLMGDMGLVDSSGAVWANSMEGQDDASMWKQARLVVGKMPKADSMCDREYSWWTLYTYQVLTGKVCPDAA